VILQLAQKVLSAAKKLDLPEALSEEIDRFYRLMLSKTSWERNELILSFTSARASLLYLLKDSGAVAPEDQARVGRLGVALECGLWFQSLDIAAQELEDKHLEAFNTVYLDPDYVDYFTRSLTRTKGSNHQLYKQLNTINMNCETAIVDERLSGDELKAIQASLSEVLN
jgi:hypothetical protein